MVPGISTSTPALPEAALSGVDRDLLDACRGDDDRSVRRQLEAGAEVDVHDGAGRRPLGLAAERGNLAAMRLLAEAGARIDARDAGKTPWTALMHALHAGQGAAALALLEWGADPDVRDDSGYSALMMAASRGDSCVVEQLLARGADPKAELFLGFTALDYAIGYGHLGIVRILLEAAPALRHRRNPARRAMLALADEAGQTEILALVGELPAG